MNHKEANMGTAKGDTDMTKERESEGHRGTWREREGERHPDKTAQTKTKHDTQVRHSNKNLKMNKITKRTGNTKD